MEVIREKQYTMYMGTTIEGLQDSNLKEVKTVD